MLSNEKVWAIGLMSGTSLDGIDAALIYTDGQDILERGPHLTIPYEPAMREHLRDAIAGRGDVMMIEREMTLRHADAVKAVMEKADLGATQVAVIGFPGQTLVHRPKEGITWQIGNANLLVQKTGISVVGDFRRRDVAEGGQGAPLVPLYHAALAKHLPLPVAVLNLGGIANVTWIGRSEEEEHDILAHDIVAFDTGPGNALVNDWVREHRKLEYDPDGQIALAGKVHEDIVKGYFEDPYFAMHPPKSLDRHYFTLERVRALSVEDGAATLAAFTAQSVARALEHFPGKVKQWLVAGGGRHNLAIMKMLEDVLGADKVKTVEAVGWEGDSLEAQAFAFLAVRSMRGLPLTLPTTTGVDRMVTGGAFYQA